MLSGYGRSAYLSLFGLDGDPFFTFPSLTVEDVDKLYVHRRGDEKLDSTVLEVLSMRSTGFVAVCGGYGEGKTTCLTRLFRIFEQSDAKALMAKTKIGLGKETVLEICRLIVRSAEKKSLRIFRLSIRKHGVEEAEVFSSPAKAGFLLAEELKRLKPCALLIDDLQNVFFMSSRWKYFLLEMIRQVASNLDNGVLLVFSTTPHAYDAVGDEFPALTSRVHLTVKLEPLSDEEALVLVRKRLTHRRVRRVSKPLHPFNEEVVRFLNEYVGGNPRELLRVLSECLRIAIDLRKRRVDEEVVNIFVERNKPLMEILSSIPRYLRLDYITILNYFKGGPVRLNRVAELLGIPVEDEFFRLEELVNKGVLEKEGDSYRIPTKIMREIVRRSVF